LNVEFSVFHEGSRVGERRGPGVKKRMLISRKDYFRKNSYRRKVVLLLPLHAPIEFERLGQPLDSFGDVRLALKHDVADP
jgi:hypothetical protein